MRHSTNRHFRRHAFSAGAVWKKSLGCHLCYLTRESRSRGGIRPATPLGSGCGSRSRGTPFDFSRPASCAAVLTDHAPCRPRERRFPGGEGDVSARATEGPSTALRAGAARGGAHSATGVVSAVLRRSAQRRLWRSAHPRSMLPAPLVAGCQGDTLAVESGWIRGRSCRSCTRETLIGQFT